MFRIDYLLTLCSLHKEDISVKGTHWLFGTLAYSACPPGLDTLFFSVHAVTLSDANMELAFTLMLMIPSCIFLQNETYQLTKLM